MSASTTSAQHEQAVACTLLVSNTAFTYIFVTMIAIATGATTTIAHVTLPSSAASSGGVEDLPLSIATRVKVSGVFGSIGGRMRNFSGLNGDIYTTQLRDKDGSRNASFWHDIPWRPSNGTADEFWFVCEIPKGTCAKMETMTTRLGNPIQQDEKFGRPRFFSMGISPFNYGMIPQTWESPFEESNLTGIAGDSDPIDVVELSGRACEMGKAYRVRAYAALGMIDGNVTDWKVLTRMVTVPPLTSNGEGFMDLEKPMADEGNTRLAAPPESRVEDNDDTVNPHLDGRILDKVVGWFRNYKRRNCLKARDSWATNDTYFQTVVDKGWARTCTEIYDDYKSNLDACSLDSSDVTFSQFSDDLQLQLPNSTSSSKKYFINKESTMEVIRETHRQWQRLLLLPGEDDPSTGQRFIEAAGKFVPMAHLPCKNHTSWKPAYEADV
eukprot:CAMPEP_0118953200 /NCGR_PEP_ID=MMETSP1169-20130426/56149_1 /TAXON_ID=36882 /ORGANISM="Pyramimonas obovata, Strain CCMP722" /LENGTH=438 /DNA_ID=CAMNT_0006900597 /DNA_START=126 /DNA_END=1442 /DNA_ORIENTATION=-